MVSCSSKIMATNSASSSSFRLITTRIPLSLFNNHPLSKSQFFLPSPSKPFFSFKPITFQKLPTKSSPSSSTASLQPIEDLPPKLQEIVKLFQSVQEPKAKYEQLLFYGKSLKLLDAQFKTLDNKVEGCVSQVWVRAYLDNDKNVVYEADSDSVLTKGLAALLVQGFSGRPVQEIIRVTPDFVTLLGLQQSLTPSRNNGFLNMLKLMQKKAFMLYVESEKGAEFNSKVEAFVENENENSSRGHGSVIDDDVTPLAPLSSSSSDSDENVELRGRGKRIREKLEKELSPIELEVEDVSYQHAGHAGGGGGDGETHFNVKVVSKEFEGKSLVKRHRLIYSLLQEDLQAGLHALSIVAKTPSEVEG